MTILHLPCGFSLVVHRKLCVRFLNRHMILRLAHFNPHYTWAKMILSRFKNILMPTNVNSIVIVIIARNICLICVRITGRGWGLDFDIHKID